MLKKLLKKLSPSFQCEKCQEGELYAIPNQGQFSILKILKVKSKGLHVCIYSNLYNKIPKKINENELYIDKSSPFSSRHTPLTYSSLKLWKPLFLQDSKVKHAELDAYLRWKMTNPYYI